MSEYTQTGAPMRIDTVLDEDVLLLEGFVGQEGISQSYGYLLDLLSEDPRIDPDDLLRTDVCLTLDLPGGETRHVHGRIHEFAQLGRTDELTHYQARIAPWSWWLSLSRDCRIFQEMDVLEIVEQVFSDQGHSDFDNRCVRRYPKRTYCVQYRESHLDFVSRLLEEEGIFYFFEHSDTGHTLVLADDNSAFKPCPGAETVRIMEDAPPGEDVVRSLRRKHSVHLGRVTLRDYDYLKPTLPLESSVSGEAWEEAYDFPGGYAELEEGDRFTRIRLEESEVGRHMVRGSGRCRGFLSGHRFDLTHHYRSDANDSYVLLELRHEGSVGGYRSGVSGSSHYSNDFLATPHGVPFRPSRVTRRPAIQGTQTAEVVGPSGEEIWVDEHGRIKVQFHWDRVGAKDEKSSCWIRVASTWAGRGWGFIETPRIGQEVLVDFLEGDPDRPIVVGSVYNARQTPPWSLPDERTVSGVRSQSSKGGGGFNEISLEDRKDEERLHLHAQKDMDVKVLNDQSTSVDHDQSTAVGNDQSITVGNDRTLQTTGARKETVKKDTSLTVSEGNYVRRIESGKSEEFVKANRSVKVDGQSAMEFKGNSHVKVTEGDLELKTEEKQVKIEGKDGVGITSPEDVSLQGKNVKAKGDMEVSIDGQKISLAGTTEVTLSVGANFIKIDASGVTIFGTIVKIN